MTIHELYLIAFIIYQENNCYILGFIAVDPGKSLSKLSSAVNKNFILSVLATLHLPCIHGRNEMKLRPFKMFNTVRNWERRVYIHLV